jgi:adenosylhomocysteinase
LNVTFLVEYFLLNFYVIKIPIRFLESSLSMQTLQALPQHEVKNLALATQGLNQINWALQDMPVLAIIRKRFEAEQPFKGLRISACGHLTKELAALAITMQAGGADAVVIASNPLSTQDDVAASLVSHYGIATFGFAGETVDTFKNHVEIALNHSPHIIMDDGGDLVAAVLQQRPELSKQLIGSTEETTAGITRLKSLDKQKLLPWPAIGVNESKTKHLFDNRYGTGQSTLDGIFRACNILLSGKTVVVVGYGWCGRGVALRARGMGANVIVCEVDHMKALEAVMEGYRVMPMMAAAPLGDLFITITSNKYAIDAQHFPLMKDQAILCNAGHFNWEFNHDALVEQSVAVTEPRAFVQACKQADGRTLYSLCEGRLVNLIAAEGHPSSVMDMSFSNQAMGVEYLVQNHGKLPNNLLTLPYALDYQIAQLKLEALGIGIDTMTPAMDAYMASWSEGTQ